MTRLPTWLSTILAAVLGFAIALLTIEPVTATIVKREIAEALVEIGAALGIGVPVVRGHVRRAAAYGEAATYAKAVENARAEVPAKKAPAKKAAPRKRG